MKKIVTGSLAFFLFLSTLAFAEDLKTATMKIDGMTCKHCVGQVEIQLSSLCKHLTIDLEKGEGVCQYAPPVTPEQIVTEANKTGYKTTLK